MQKVKIKEENEGGQQTVVTVGGNRQEKRKRIMSYFINATIELMEKDLDYWKDVMVEVFNNGKVIEENINNFDQIKELANA